MSEEKKYAELFAMEARDQLTNLARALVDLEGQPTDPELLNSIFRALHTIKGMSAAMSYDVPTRLSHNMESVLDELRSGRRSIDRELIDLLLEGADALGEAVEATVAGGQTVDPAPVVDRLVMWRLNRTAEATRPTGPAEETRASGVTGRAGAAHRSRTAAARADAGRLRVDVRRLDSLMNLVGELTIVRGELEGLATGIDSEPLHEALERTGRLIADLQSEVVESRMVPVWQVFDRFPRLVRDAARLGGKEIDLVISGKELELDRALLDAISEPLVHLLRNAVDHGIEPAEEREASGKPRTGRIELTARRERSRVTIEVIDDGRGVDRQAVLARARREGLAVGEDDSSDLSLFRVLAHPGFSTATEVTTLSGRGVGLNVVEESIRGLGGSVELTSHKGAGTRVRLELPLTLAIVRALIVRVGEHSYALPATFARESFEVAESAIKEAEGREWVDWRDELVPLTRLPALFGADGPVSGGLSENVSVVGLEFGGLRTAVSVDDFEGEEEIVIKPVTMPCGAVPVFSGATVRRDGRPALVLDAGSLATRAATPTIG